MDARERAGDEGRRRLGGDTEADIAVMTSLLEWPPATEEEVRGITTPSLVYCGEEDPFITGTRRAAELMPKVRFLPMPSYNHVSAFVESHIIMPYIAAFLMVADQI